MTTNEAKIYILSERFRAEESINEEIFQIPTIIYDREDENPFW